MIADVHGPSIDACGISTDVFVLAACMGMRVCVGGCVPNALHGAGVAR